MRELYLFLTMCSFLLPSNNLERRDHFLPYLTTDRKSKMSSSKPHLLRLRPGSRWLTHCSLHFSLGRKIEHPDPTNKAKEIWLH